MIDKNYTKKRFKCLVILAKNKYNLLEIIRTNNCCILDLEICHYNNFGYIHRKFLKELYNLKLNTSTTKKTLKFIMDYPAYSRRLMYVNTKRNNLNEECNRKEKENKAKYENNLSTYKKIWRLI